ncbi:MAG TPA: [protein-PII] uridylyltransferase [Blastocatellia bacterium]|nr:[protein-PII] uridylyltransferase [Blastocatellia bacterium]HMZ19719.1 [protein-PII] uridylyltransferase [Blastocatellia bacterium]HNG31704.1 [protein-PII] uridylyltransferase [Blastocatellia bacterium]
MQINLATIEHHATEKLRRIENQPGAAERLAALKKFLKIETQRLHLRHRFGISGSAIVAARSLLVDLTIQRIARSAVEERLGEAAEVGNFAVVALGGYGRQELSPQSDIDVLFLYQGRKDADRAAKLSEAMLYLLWDAGFSVGHSVRSLSECVSIAREDIISRNSMIDARLLWGSREVFDSLCERLDEEVFEKQKRVLLDEQMAERLTRYKKFGDAVCLQEPNVKETAGGLRDLHELLWASRAAYGTASLKELTERGIIPEREAKAINAAYDFLTRVRNEIHFLTNRKSDLLSLDLQQQVARNLRYADTPEQQASELFMRDYYLHARRLHRLCETYLQRAAASLAKASEKKNWLSRLRSAARLTPAAGGFAMSDGELELADAGEPLDGNRMMMAFSYAQATGANLSSALQEAIQAALPGVNKAFRSSPEATQAFLKMLRAKGRVAAGLRLMHEMDFLGKYLPEFGRVTCLVQHDLYHRYTVDEHTLRTIEALDNLADSRGKSLERYRGVLNQIWQLSDPATLHLGLLMHDIGKGLGGGHTQKGVEITKRLCARLQLEEQMTEQVVFLVEKHLLMSHIAQRRDLSDEKIISDFAAQVGTVEKLNMLCLLTYGDINGVGPTVWNEWKDALLWELYVKARAVLLPEEEGGSDVEPLRARIARMLSSEVDQDEVRKHFKLLPADYGRFVPPQVIIEHIRLIAALNSRQVKTSWRVNAQSRCTDLHLCARNRRGLFAAVAGALTAQGVNILSVHLNTRADGFAVDSFKVRDAAGEPINDPARWEQIDAELKRALAGEADVAAAVAKRLRAQTTSKFSSKRKMLAAAPTRFSWDNFSSNKSTILEVCTGDQLGLAYKIASTLTALDLDIVFAKVATEKHLALDIFYVTDAAGEKLQDEHFPSIEAALLQALTVSRA